MWNLFLIFFFSNHSQYNKLCMDKNFYNRFKKYEYILISQTDSIILDDKLDFWCKRSLSYIGGPSYHKKLINKKPKSPKFFCNGGFSLRKTNDFIRVLESSKIGYPFNYLTIYECLKSGFYRYIKLYLRTLFSKNIYKGESFAKNLYIKEDSFWTYFAPLFYKKYSLPTIDQANSFCFDGNPNFFYKMNKYKLPMALHGPFDYLKFLEKLNIQI